MIGIADSKIVADGPIVIGKGMVLTIDHAELARSVGFGGLEDALDVGHCGVGEGQDVRSQIRRMVDP